MKKVTFFTYDAYKDGGTERVMTMLANELSKTYEVEMISVHKTYEKPFYHISDNIKVIDYNYGNTEPLIRYLPFLAMSIKKRLEDYKTDVVICVGMRYVPFCISLRKRAKFIAWEHYTSFVNKPFSVGDIGRRIAAKKADKIVVLTKKDRENNIKMFKTDADRIVQIYNADESKAVSDKYDIDSKKIITAGRFMKQKGFDFLVEVAEKVFKEHPDWQWDIYGDGNLRPEIEQLIKEKNLEKNVILKGVSNNLYDLYKDYAMYVMTSRYEGYPMVNMEAHSAKLPIVSFNCPCGPDELIEDGVNGYIVECFDIDKMAEKINFLIEHPEVRQNMSDNTSKDKEKLKMENIIKEWEKIIEEQ